MAQSQWTLSQLVAAVRQISNQETPNPSSAFVKDPEIRDRINEARYELYDLMLAAEPDSFVTSTTFTLSASNVYALSGVPDPGFYRLNGLDVNVGGQVPATVHRFNFAERNRYTAQNYAGTYTLWYTPRLTELVADSDKLDVFTDNYRRWIIHSAAVDVMAKAEESDPSSALAIKAEEGQRILGAVAARNVEPRQIPDVTSTYMDDWLCGGSARAYSIEGSNLVIR